MNTIPPITITVAEARLLADLLEVNASAWGRDDGLNDDTAAVIERNEGRAAELRQMASEAIDAFRAAYAKPTT